MKSMKNDYYINGIDGLRAFAVLAVLFYHFGFSFAGGGFLGVDMFFVISGYLITSSILKQKTEYRFSLRKFWIKRIRRLIPAVYLMIIIAFAWTALFKPDIIAKMKGDAAASLIYMTNWWFIFHKVSYFNSFGSPSPLKNLWSLAIEEQFYIVWPIILSIGIKTLKKRKKLSNVIFMVALCSATLMAVIYKPGEDPSRVYYGTDTRAFELLIGCCLAVIHPIYSPYFKKTSNRQRNRLNILSIAAFAIFIGSIVLVNEYNPFLYRGYMLLFSINSALLILCVCKQGNSLGRFLSCKPLSWIGKRSYGIYLWHYPIFVLSTPINEIGNINYWRMAFQIIITFIIADISYRFIETPIRRNGFKGSFINLLNSGTKSREVKKGSFFSRRRYPVILISIIIIIIGLTVATACVGSDYNDKQHVNKVNNAATRQPSTETKNPGTSHNENNEVGSLSVHKSYDKVLAIGDSVMVDIAPTLKKECSNIVVDGKVGRQLYEAAELAPKYSNFNDEHDAVVIELGTNGYFTDDQIDKLLNSFSKAHVYLVNTRVPRQWERYVNQSLRKKTQERKNVTLIDWNSVAIEHPEYFTPDGVHLVNDGIKVLVLLIDKALNG